MNNYWYEVVDISYDKLHVNRSATQPLRKSLSVIGFKRNRQK